MTDPISSVDPSAEIDAVFARLQTLESTVDGKTVGKVYDGIPAGTELPVNALGKKLPYRDYEPGGTIPSGQGRTVGGNEQQQPHVWTFQIHHFGSTRKLARDLAIQTERSLVGWKPTENASTISGVFFNMYDETAKNGENLGWIATRFYECVLGLTPDFSLTIPD